ncbi:GNAT family N-acetyltransferase [Staphylococcus simulans]|uniref:GNAT family N-acetyltransferase n=1 Tax=Staphylococcus simulans TaxID=1286 RepID=UPI00399A7892
MFKIAQSKQELQDVFDVRIEVFVHEQNVPLENELDEFEDVSTHIIGYDENNRPIATARYRDYNGVAKMERVAVLKDYRKHGIGRELMKYIETIAKNNGYSKATLNGQIQAQPFYESLGYKAEGDVFLEENIEHVTMKKTL